MGLSASQSRFLMLTAKRSDLEFNAQQISQKRLMLSNELEAIAQNYERATSNRVMNIVLYDFSANAEKPNKVEKNLTYSNVVSGSYAAGYLNGASNGIETTSAYRVADANGNTVVASLDEIPDTRFVKVEKPLTELLDENSMVSDAAGNKYFVNDSAAKTILDNGLDKNCSYRTEDDICIIHTTNDNPNGAWWVYNDSKTMLFSNNCGGGAFVNGKVVEFHSVDEFPNSVTIISTEEASKMKKSVIETQNLTKNVEKNVCTLTAPNGDVVATYIIDNSLKGGNAGPNYFQDCLLNGKYMLEKTSVEQKDEAGNQTWSAISWDATTEISETYYTQDDAAAKAKYDRLQTQIQNRDKKLELELDNIETQRSAITTEVESVQKVIDDNIESTFKTFA